MTSKPYKQLASDLVKAGIDAFRNAREAFNEVDAAGS